MILDQILHIFQYIKIHLDADLLENLLTAGLGSEDFVFNAKRRLGFHPGNTSTCRLCVWCI